MKHKISLFDKGRGQGGTASPGKAPWRMRRRDSPKDEAESRAETTLNSLRINTSDFRPLDLLRRYDEEANHVSPTPARSSGASSAPFHETSKSERGWNHAPQHALKNFRGAETLFLTAGYAFDTNGSEDLRDIVSNEKTRGKSEETERPSRAKQFYKGLMSCRKTLFALSLILAGVCVPIALSSLLDNFSGFSQTTSGRSLWVSRPFAGWTGYPNRTKDTSRSRALWVDHVVTGEKQQLLIAETFESRMNAEVAPLLEKYMDQIWEDSTRTEMKCGEGEQAMIAFSMAKAASLPASIIYEGNCVNASNVNRCYQRKQISDVRDLVVRLPIWSSRYMYAVFIEESGESRHERGQERAIRHIRPLGTISGQFRVELSDGCRLALQRYCGRNRKAYADDLRIELVNHDNTRLINIYELKRLYGLLNRNSNSGDLPSASWDGQELSVATIDPLEHSRHALTPIHIENLLSGLADRRHATSLPPKISDAFPSSLPSFSPALDQGKNDK